MSPDAEEPKKNYKMSKDQEAGFWLIFMGVMASAFGFIFWSCSSRIEEITKKPWLSEELPKFNESSKGRKPQTLDEMRKN
jgi:hypothetical protein